MKKGEILFIFILVLGVSVLHVIPLKISTASSHGFGSICSDIEGTGNCCSSADCSLGEFCNVDQECSGNCGGWCSPEFYCCFGPGCALGCAPPECGDGDNTGVGEQCDLGAGNGPSEICTPFCQDAICGDGFICNGVGCTSGPGGGIEECDNGGICQFNAIQECFSDLEFKGAHASSRSGK